jgi:hypothetical protein
MRPPEDLHREVIARLVDGPLRDRLCPVDPARCRATGCARAATHDCGWAVLRDRIAASE